MEKKEFNIKKYLWILPLIIGLLVVLIGVSKINSAKDMYVPNMGDYGWFDASVKQSKAESSGVFICSVGFLIGIMGTIMCFVVPRISHANKKHLNSSETSLFSDKNNLKTEEFKKCKYCGSLSKLDITECESCGGKEFKKHKH